MRDKLARAMSVFDFDKDGDVTVHDFTFFMTRYGRKLSREVVDEMIDELRAENICTNDEHINIERFVDFLLNVKKTQTM